MMISWLGQGWIEVSYVSWDPLESYKWKEYTPDMEIGDLPVQKMLYTGNRAVINSFTPGQNYRVRIKALYQPAEELTVSIHPTNNANSRPLAFPNYINMKFVGSYQESNQTLTITMPRYSPMVGLYDYVLFSEDVLQK